MLRLYRVEVVEAQLILLTQVRCIQVEQAVVELEQAKQVELQLLVQQILVAVAEVVEKLMLILLVQAVQV